MNLPAGILKKKIVILWCLSKNDLKIQFTFVLHAWGFVWEYQKIEEPDSLDIWK